MWRWMMVPALGLAVGAPTVVAAAEEKTAASGAKDLVETVVAGEFNTLVAAVKTAGLIDVLKGKGPLTLFVPTDEAFEKLPKGTLASLLEPENRERLRAILESHVVAGRYPAAQLAKQDQLKSLSGRRIEVAAHGDGVKVDDARVIQTDIVTSNGVVHVIDAVILPE